MLQRSFILAFIIPHDRLKELLARLLTHLQQTTRILRLSFNFSRTCDFTTTYVVPQWLQKLLGQASETVQNIFHAEGIFSVWKRGKMFFIFIKCTVMAVSFRCPERILSTKNLIMHLKNIEDVENKSNPPVKPTYNLGTPLITLQFNSYPIIDYL